MHRPRLNGRTPLFIAIEAGSPHAERVQREMTDVLRAARRQHHFFTINDPKNTEAECRRAANIASRHEGAIIVAGGSSTIGAGMNAALPTGRPFGVVPFDPFEQPDPARGLELEPASATAALLTSQVLPKQVGCVNDRCFLVNAKVGLYPEILEQRDTRQFRRVRQRAGALWSALGTLWRGQQRFVIELRHGDDREVVQTPTLLIGNDGVQLPRIGVDQDDDMERHALAATVVRPVATPRLFWLALCGAIDALAVDENVRSFAFRRLTVRPRFGRWGSVRVAIDGEVRWMQAPLVFSVSQFPLMLMTPAHASSAVAA